MDGDENMHVEYRTKCSKCGKEIVKKADKQTEEERERWLKFMENRFGHGAYCDECLESKRTLQNRMGKGYLR